MKKFAVLFLMITLLAPLFAAVDVQTGIKEEQVLEQAKEFQEGLDRHISFHYNRFVASAKDWERYRYWEVDTGIRRSWIVKLSQTVQALSANYQARSVFSKSAQKSKEYRKLEQVRADLIGQLEKLLKNPVYLSSAEKKKLGELRRKKQAEIQRAEIIQQEEARKQRIRAFRERQKKAVQKKTQQDDAE